MSSSTENINGLQDMELESTDAQKALISKAVKTLGHSVLQTYVKQAGSEMSEEVTMERLNELRLRQTLRAFSSQISEAIGKLPELSLEQIKRVFNAEIATWRPTTAGFPIVDRFLKELRNKVRRFLESPASEQDLVLECLIVEEEIQQPPEEQEQTILKSSITTFAQKQFVKLGIVEKFRALQKNLHPLKKNSVLIHFNAQVLITRINERVLQDEVTAPVFLSLIEQNVASVVKAGRKIQECIPSSEKTKSFLDCHVQCYRDLSSVIAPELGISVSECTELINRTLSKEPEKNVEGLPVEDAYSIFMECIMRTANHIMDPQGPTKSSEAFVYKTPIKWQSRNTGTKKKPSDRYSTAERQKFYKLLDEYCNSLLLEISTFLGDVIGKHALDANDTKEFLLENARNFSRMFSKAMVKCTLEESDVTIVQEELSQAYLIATRQIVQKIQLQDEDQFAPALEAEIIRLTSGMHPIDETATRNDVLDLQQKVEIENGKKIMNSEIVWMFRVAAFEKSNVNEYIKRLERGTSPEKKAKISLINESENVASRSVQTLFSEKVSSMDFKKYLEFALAGTDRYLNSMQGVIGEESVKELTKIILEGYAKYATIVLRAFEDPEEEIMCASILAGEIAKPELPSGMAWPDDVHRIYALELSACYFHICFLKAQHHNKDSYGPTVNWAKYLPKMRLKSGETVMAIRPSVQAARATIPEIFESLNSQSQIFLVQHANPYVSKEIADENADALLAYWYQSSSCLDAFDPSDKAKIRKSVEKAFERAAAMTEALFAANAAHTTANNISSTEVVQETQGVEIGTATEAINERGPHIDKIEEIRAQLKAALEQAEQERQALTAERAALAQQAAVVAAERAAVDQKKQELAQEMDDMATALANEKEEIAREALRIAAERELVEEKKQELAQEMDDMAAVLSGEKEEIAQAKKALTHEQNTLELLAVELGQKEQELGLKGISLRSILDTLAQTALELNAKTTTIENMHNALVLQGQALEAQLEELKEMRAELDFDLESLKQEREDLDIERTELAQEWEELENEKEAFIEERDEETEEPEPDVITGFFDGNDESEDEELNGEPVEHLEASPPIVRHQKTEPATPPKVKVERVEASSQIEESAPSTLAPNTLDFEIEIPGTLEEVVPVCSRMKTELLTCINNLYRTREYAQDMVQAHEMSTRDGSAVTSHSLSTALHTIRPNTAPGLIIESAKEYISLVHTRTNLVRNLYRIASAWSHSGAEQHPIIRSSLTFCQNAETDTSVLVNGDFITDDQFVPNVESALENTIGNIDF